MSYISNEQYNNIHNIRDMLNGCLNRIAVTDDPAELERMLESAKHNLEKYAKHNRDRIKGEYNPDPIWTPDKKLEL